MRWMHKLMALPALAAAAMLAGCPAPVLRVSPAAVDFASDQNTADLMIHNDGAGSLEWQVVESLPWLTAETVQKQEGSATAGAPSVVELRVDRAGLPVGVTRGDVTVTSNGGERVVPVSVNVGGPAELQVSSNALDFGTTATQQNVIITNRGLEALAWSVSIPQSASWLRVTPATGNIPTLNGVQTVSFAADRTGIAPGTYNAVVSVTSNGGSATINVTMSVVPFSVSPSSLEFGLLQQSSTQSLTIRNLGGTPVAASYTVSTQSGGNWLSAARASDVIAISGAVGLPITVNPTGLAPGDYSGSVTVTAAGVSISVPVTFTRTALNVTPDLLDFGPLLSGTSAPQTFAVQNSSGTPIDYTVSIPAAAQGWLNVTPIGDGSANGTVTHTVTIDPDGVEPGPQEANIDVDFAGGAETVTVRWVKQRPARLVVVSQSINFGTTGTEERIDIWNDGEGTVNWSINTAGFPAWLTLEGPTSGTVSGETTDTVTLRVNRSLAPAGVFDLAHSFNVVATGDFAGNVPVSVQATIPRVPRIEVVGQAVNDDGVVTLTIGEDLTTRTFIIRNNGNGVLNWSINPAQVPAWISSITPLQGGLDPGTEQSVQVTVDRSTLDFRGASVQLQIIHNDPTIEAGNVPIIITVVVPKKVAIIARPGTITFDADDNIAGIEIANNGDPGTTMNYRIRSSADNFLKVFPTTGTSEGTEGNIKDFKAHTVAIVRSELATDGSAGKLTIEAIRTVDGRTEVLPDVAPLEINVTIEAAELTFQNAQPRLRVPSIVRFVMLMRNLRYAPILLSNTRLSQLEDQFQIVENDVPVDLDESERVIKPNAFIRGNLLIMLDYSNSMQQAARSVADVTISGAPDPLQALYERSISQLISEIPANYRVGLAVFSDRDGNTVDVDALRPILGGATEGPDTEDEVFISDRNLLQERLDNIFVATNGATELYPAISEASDLLFEQDNFAGIFPFDDADDRIILCVTDGRATTPPGQVVEIIDGMVRIDRTRAFIIGWGNDVSTGPLVVLANETGGHIYSTQTERVTSGGVTTVRPVVEELEDYTTTIDADACDLSVRRDLLAQFMLSYVSLNEEASAAIEGRLNFDDPTDQSSPCLTDQGDIEGKFFGEQVPMSTFAGDPRMSQIKMDYSGRNVDGTGRVLVYLDAAGRDIRRFRLQFTPQNATLDPADIQLVPATQGGVLNNWTITRNGLTVTLESPDGTPLPYGDFGAMLTVDLEAIGGNGRLELAVAEPVFAANDPNTRFVIHPDSIPLNTPSRFLAPSFAMPGIQLALINGADPGARQLERLPTGEFFLDLGADVDDFALDFYNIGGAHQPTDKSLQFIISPNAQALVIRPDTEDPEFWSNVFVYGTQDPQRRTFDVVRDRPIFPVDGRTSEEPFQIEFEYFLVNIGYGGEMLPLILKIDQSAPEVDVDPNAVAFPNGTDQQGVDIINNGQSILDWSLEFPTPAPAWLSFSNLEGTIQPFAAFTLLLTIDRGLLPAGPQTYSFNVVSDDPVNTSSETITITVPNTP